MDSNTICERKLVYKAERIQACDSKCCDSNGQHAEKYVLCVIIGLKQDRPCHTCSVYNPQHSTGGNTQAYPHIFHWNWEGLNEKDEIIKVDRELLLCSEHSLKRLEEVTSDKYLSQSVSLANEFKGLANDKTIKEVELSDEEKSLVPKIEVKLNMSSFDLWRVKKMLAEPSDFLQWELQTDIKLAYLDSLDEPILEEYLRKRGLLPKEK